MRPRGPFLAAAASVGALFVAGLALGQYPLPMHPMATDTPQSVLTAPIPDGPAAAQVRRGRDLVIAADCLACHMRAGGRPFEGGFGVETPFGIIFSSNITPDAETGIGRWSADQFYRAMHDGVSPHGNLYPAFPYPSFRRMSRADDDDVFAYLRSLPASHYTPPSNKLPFPFNIRGLMGVWNWLFFKTKDFTPDASQTAEWNRGAYLVTGPGHCGACHTPKNFLGGDESGKELYGSPLNLSVAPNLTSSPRTGLGSWTVQEIALYLKDGRNARASASGDMADVVSDSTSLMSDPDRQAMAVYLKSRPAAPDPHVSAPGQDVMNRGAQIYSDACTSCHLEGGVGQAGEFPPLGHNAVAQQPQADGVIHMILAGTRVAPTADRPSPLAMPSFAWKLSDQEVADVTTYVRNSWSNHARAVSPGQVQGLRRKLKLDREILTANSGDHH